MDHKNVSKSPLISLSNPLHYDLHLFPSIGEVYFSNSWIWNDPITDDGWKYVSVKGDFNEFLFISKITTTWDQT